MRFDRPQPAKLNQAQRENETKNMYSMLVMIGAVAVLWIGVVLLMAEVHKNARPVFIVLGGVITVGLGYAWYDFNRKAADVSGSSLDAVIEREIERRNLIDKPQKTEKERSNGEKMFTQKQHDEAIAAAKNTEHEYMQRLVNEERARYETLARNPPAGGRATVVGAAREGFSAVVETMTGRGGVDDSHLSGVQKANKKKWEQNGWKKVGGRWKRDRKYASYDVVYTHDSAPSGAELK